MVTTETLAPDQPTASGSEVRACRCGWRQQLASRGGEHEEFRRSHGSGNGRRISPATTAISLLLLVSAVACSQIEITQNANNAAGFSELFVDVSSESAVVGDVLVSLENSTDVTSLGHLSLCPSSPVRYSPLDDRLAAESSAHQVFSLENELEGNVVLLSRQMIDDAVASFGQSPVTITLPVIAEAADTNATSEAVPWYCLQRSLIAVRVRFHLPVAAPQFARPRYAAAVYEDAPVGSTVAGLLSVTARSSHAVTYALEPSAHSHLVELRVTGGGYVQLLTATPHRRLPAYNLTVHATVGSRNGTLVSSSASIDVSVVGVNDHRPAFAEQRYSLTLAEDVAPGASVGRFAAADPDDEYDGEVYYGIVGGLDSPAPFAIHSTTGVIYTTNILDYERRAAWTFNISARDRGQPSLATYATVGIAIEDVNEFWPSVTAEPSELVFVEEQGADVVLTRLTIRDKDSRSPGLLNVTGVLFRGVASDLVGVRRVPVDHNGSDECVTYAFDVLTGSVPFDRELHPDGLVLDVVVVDDGSPPHQLLFPLSVRLLDANDHVPELRRLSVSASELVPVGTQIHVFSASDGDIGDAGSLVFTLSEQPHFKLGASDRTRAALLTNASLDREERSAYTLNLTVSDGGTPRQQRNFTIAVSIEDANDNTPAFTGDEFSATIPESLAVGASVVTVTAVDADAGSNSRLRFSVISQRAEGFFAVDPVTGELQVARTIDYERDPRELHAVVEATDLGTPLARSSTCRVRVTVTNVDDEAPATNMPAYRCFIPEHSGTQRCTQIYAVDPDSASLNYSLAPSLDSRFFSVDGDGLLVAPTTVDRSFLKVTRLDVEITDGEQSSVVPVTVVVTDRNTRAPELPGPFLLSVPRTAGFDQVVARIGTSDDDDLAENALVMLAVQPDNVASFPFHVDPTTHEVRVATRAPLALGLHGFLVTACDNGEPRAKCSGQLRYILHVQQDSDVPPPPPPAVSSAPVFSQPEYFQIIDVSSAAGSEVLAVSARDANDAAVLVRYSLLTANSSCFALNNGTGAVTVFASMPAPVANGTAINATDRSRPLSQCFGTHRLVVKAIAGDVTDTFATATVIVTVAESSEPQLCSDHLSRTVHTLLEGVPETFNTTLPAVGVDTLADSYRVLNYDGTNSLVFAIDSEATVYTVDELDSSRTEWYFLIVAVYHSSNSSIVVLNGTSAGNGSSPSSAVVIAGTMCSITFRVQRQPCRPRLQERYAEEVWDSAPVGTRVLRVGDTTINSSCQEFRLESGDGALLFSVDAVSGVVSVASSLVPQNGRAFRQYELNVTIRIASGQPWDREVSTLVTVLVKPARSQAPQFSSSSPTHLALNSGLAIGERVGQFVATARDPFSNSTGVEYSIEPGPGAEYFSMNSSTGRVQIAALFPEVDRTLLDLVIVATSMGQIPQGSRQPVSVTVSLGNRHAPQFTLSTYRVPLREDLSIGDIFSLTATDDDILLGPRNRFGLVSYNCTPVTADQEDLITFAAFTFSLIGSLVGRAREFVQLCTAFDLPRDRSQTLVSVPVRVLFQVVDGNDNSPRLEAAEASLHVRTDAPVGTVVGSVNATDADVGPNSRILYRLVTASLDFSVDAFSGDVSVATDLCASQDCAISSSPQQVLTIEAMDLGIPPRDSNRITVTVAFNDSSNRPAILWPLIQSIAVAPSFQPGDVIGALMVRGGGSPQQALLFSLLDTAAAQPLFELNVLTGSLKALHTPRPQPTAHYLRLELTSDATRSEGRVVVTSSPAIPRAPDCEPTAAVVRPDEDVPAGTAVFGVRCTAPASGAALRMRLLRTSSDFTVVPTTLTLATAGRLSHSRNPRHDLVLEISEDAGTGAAGPTAVVVVTVLVGAVPSNRHSPLLVPSDFRTLNLSETSPLHASVGRVIAVDLDPAGPDSSLTYVLSHGTAAGHVAVNSSSGEITLNSSSSPSCRRAASAAGRLTAFVSVSDAATVPRRSPSRVQFRVTDENDNAAVFSQGLYELTVAESDLTAPPRSTFVAAISVTDGDTSRALNVDLRTRSAGDDMGLRVQRVDAGLYLLVTRNDTFVDTRHGNVQLIEVQAYDATDAAAALVSSCFVRLAVRESANQHGPACVAETASPTVYSNLAAGSVVAHLVGVDRDQGANGAWRFVNVTGSGLFSLDASSGVVRLGGSIASRRGVLREVVFMQDSGEPQRLSRCLLNITVIAAGPVETLRQPSFRRNGYFLAADDSLDVGALLNTVDLVDEQPGYPSHCTLLGDVDNRFVVAPNSGRLIVASALLPGRSRYNFTVECARAGPFAETAVIVSIRKTAPAMTYAQPMFVQRLYQYSIVPNTTAAGTQIGCVHASLNATSGESLEYYFLDGQGKCLQNVCLNPSTGCLDITASMPTSELQWTMTVCARNLGAPDSQLDCAQVVIAVPSVDRHLPYFQLAHHAAWVPDDATIGHDITTVQAIDPDCRDGGKLTYAIRSTSPGSSQLPLAIDPDTGAITLTRTLSDLNISVVTATVHVQDAGQPSEAATTQLSVSVTPTVNPTPPSLQEVVNWAVPENLPVGSVIGTLDASSSLPLHFQLVVPSQTFSLEVNSGRLIVETTLDAETEVTYQMQAVVIDSEGQQASVDINVNVTDLNDNSPQLNVTPTQITLSTDVPANTTIATMTGRDADSGRFGDVSYALLAAGDGLTGYFAVVPTSGEVVLRRSLADVDVRETELIVAASDNGDVPRRTQRTLSVVIRDVNHHAPVFPQSVIGISLPALTPIGSLVVAAVATDMDRNSQLIYDITRGNEDNVFDVNRTTGHMTLSNNFNLSAEYNVSVLVFDGMHSDVAIALVRFTEPTEVDLTFAEDVFDVNVSEAAVPGTEVTVLRVADLLPALSAASRSYRFALLPPRRSFSVDAATGAVLVAGPLDRESHGVHTIRVQVQDATEPRRVNVGTVRVHLLDVNDNAPVFAPGAYRYPVADVTPLGAAAFQLSATDADLGVNAELRFRLLSGDPLEQFGLEAATGIVRVRRALEVLAVNEYTLLVEVGDLGVPSLSSQRTLVVVIQDANRPAFVRRAYDVSVWENATVNDFLVRVQAVSPLDNSTIRYSIHSGDVNLFRLDALSGRLDLTGGLDYEQEQSYELTLRATVPFRGNALTFADATVRVTVLDVNDNRPSFLGQLYTATLDEHVTPGFEVFRLQATDRDSGPAGTVNVTVRNISDVVTFVPANGSVILTAELDFERETAYAWSAVVTDLGTPPRSTEVPVQLFVRNLNDNAPRFLVAHQNLSIAEGTEATEVVASVDAEDDDGRLTPLTYSLIDDGSEPDEDGERQFVVGNETGLVIVARPNVARRSFYSLNISVSDGTFLDFATVAIHVVEENDFAPTFDAALYALTLTEPIGAGTPVARLNATDGDRGPLGEFRYQTLPGVHSDVFSLNASTGVVLLDRPLVFDVSRPTTGNVYAITVAATDTGGREGYAVVSLTVEDRNECAPKFVADQNYSIRISESVSVGALLISSLPTTDCDFGSNARVRYNITGASQSGLEFDVDAAIGQLVVARPINGTGKRRFRIQATDQGQPPLSSSIPVCVDVVPPADAPPVLNQTIFQLRLSEDVSEPGRFLFRVDARTANPANLPLVYLWNFTSPDELRRIQAVFALNRTSGVVTLVGRVPQFAFVRELRAHVKVQDRNGGEVFATVILTVLQTERNLSPPQFVALVFQADVYENEANGSRVQLRVPISAVDPDVGDAGEVTYSLHSPAASTPFSFNASSLQVSTRQEFDRELRDVYAFQIVASDRGSPRMHSGPATVRVQVLDRNDNPPVFSRRSYRGRVTENSVAGTPVGMSAETGPLNVSDVDSDTRLRFTVTGGNRNALGRGPVFQVDSVGGVFLLGNFLDFETKRVYVLNITVSDHRFTDHCEVEVRLDDVNDNLPQFEVQVLEANVSESLLPGVTVTRVNASDADSAMFGPLTFSLQVASEEFGIDAASGTVHTLVRLDRESQDGYIVIAQVTDAGGLSATLTVRIAVLDVNDNAPRFVDTPYRHDIQENNGYPLTFFQVRADDLDIGVNAELSFALIADGNGSFAVRDAALGLIDVVTSLDHELVSEYTLVVEVTDGGEPTRRDRTTITIVVEDVNDNSPVFMPAVPHATVNETATRGTRFATVVATDADSGTFGTVRYDLLTGNSPFGIDSNSGSVFLNREDVLDFESLRNYSVTVQASDGDLPPRQTSTQLIIGVLDNNDNRPMFQFNSYTARAVENGAPGVRVAQLSATDEDSGINARLTYSLANASLPFRVNATTGVVETAGRLDREAVDRYFVEVVATDAGTVPGPLSGSTTLQVIVDDVNDNKPTIVFPADFSFQPAPENEAGGRPILTMSSRDLDAGANADVTYFVNDTDNFRMVGDALVGNVPFDFESPLRYYGVSIWGHDNGLPRPFNTTNTVQFTVFVTNVDDQVPTGRNMAATVTQLGDQTGNDTIACIGVDDVDADVSTYSYRVHDVQPRIGDERLFDFRDRLQCRLTLSAGPAVPAALYRVQANVSDAAGFALSNTSVCVRHVTAAHLRSASVLVLATTDSPDSFARGNVAAGCSPSSSSQLSGKVAQLLVAERHATTAEDATVHLFSVEAVAPGRLAVSVASAVSRTLFRDVLQRSLAEVSRSLGVAVSSVVPERCASPGHCDAFRGTFACRRLERYGGELGSVQLDLGNFTFQSHRRSSDARCLCHPQHELSVEDGNATVVTCSPDVVDACLAMPCLGGGACVNENATVAGGGDGGFLCSCPADRTGDRCQVALGTPGDAAEQCDAYGAACSRTATATFAPTSLLVLSEFNITRMHAVSFQVRTVESSAQLLYASQLDARPGGDYAALFVMDGSVAFEMSSGGVRRAMAVDSQVDDGQWHFVELVFKPDGIQLTIDGCSSASSALDSSLCTSNITLSASYRFAHLESPVFFGHISAKHQYYLQAWSSRPASLQNYYRGCLRQLRLAGTVVQLSDPAQDDLDGLIFERGNIVAGCGYLTSACDTGIACGVDECDSTANLVDCGVGRCVTGYNPVERRYAAQCVCPVGYVTARQCQQETPRATFTAGTSIRYRLHTASLPGRSRRQASSNTPTPISVDTYVQAHTTLDVKLRTFAPAGIIFKANSSESSLILQLWQGRVQVQLRLGGPAAQVLVVASPVPINDGTWYAARVVRVGAWLSLTLTSDSGPPTMPPQQASGTSASAGSLLRVDVDAVFVGDRQLGYDGCLTDLRWDGLEVPLTAKSNLHFSVLESSLGDNGADGGLERGGCEIERCQNNGTLTPLALGTVRAVCACLGGFSGERCELDVDECASAPCPAAALRCDDLVNAYRCVYASASLRSDETPGGGDSLTIVLVALLSIVAAVSLAVVALRRYSARKIRRLQRKSMVDRVITNFGAALGPSDLVPRRHRDILGGGSGGGNVMQYGEEGGGQLDIASVHIDYDQLMRADSADQLEYDDDDSNNGADAMDMDDDGMGMDPSVAANLYPGSIAHAMGNRLLESHSRVTLRTLDASLQDGGASTTSSSSSDGKCFVNYSALAIAKDGMLLGSDTVDDEDDELAAVLAAGYRYSQPDEVDLYLGRRLQHLIEDHAAADSPIAFEDEGTCADEMSMSNWSAAELAGDIDDDNPIDSSCSGRSRLARGRASLESETGEDDDFDDTCDGAGSVSTATTNVSTLLMPAEQRYRLTFMNL